MTSSFSVVSGSVVGRWLLAVVTVVVCVLGGLVLVGGSVATTGGDGPDEVTGIVTQHGSVRVHNFEVADLHTYTITSSGHYSHNCPTDYGDAANAGVPVGQRGVTKAFTDEAGNVTSQAKYGWEMKVAPGTNSPAVIGGRSYSGHALDQMQSRGIVPTAVDDAIGYGASASSRGGTKVYYSGANDLSVVVNSEGRVATTSFGDLR